ncbi:unnamed protein product [Dovyalis caffra]|uniref:Mei2-like C-terminal RNA recognition motif domain-containing protein n=1 Tax=Dovyalis caffra TaxID=77055 RepID=A0AAV1RX16_9ROSI|nr:unnamed protein product [Dovyalis caffra]
MASMFSTDQNSTSLNPEAPEFFPHNYLTINLKNDMVARNSHDDFVNYSHQYLPNSPFLSAINQNPSSYYCYYYTSGPSHPYPYYTDIDYQHPSNAQYCVTYSHDHDLLASTVMTKPSPISAVSAQTQMVQTQDEPKLDMQQVLTARVSTGSKKRGECSRYLNGSFKGSEGRYRGHEKKQAKKEYFRARSNGSNRNSGQKHPVLPHGQDTTVMIRNIPNKYTREMLMEFLDSHCMMENEKAKLQNSDSTKETLVSAFDFLYLPIDFRGGANKGYAFVNFTDARAAWKFYLSTNYQAWDVFQSLKIREITCARLQGKEQLVRHLGNSTFQCDSDEYLPVCFSPARDGSRRRVEQKTIESAIKDFFK